MRSLEVFAGFIFFTVAFLFLVSGFGMQVKPSTHQIYQMLHVIWAVLCVGFGCLMIKQPAIKEVYED